MRLSSTVSLLQPYQIMTSSLIHFKLLHGLHVHVAACCYQQLLLLLDVLAVSESCDLCASVAYCIHVLGWLCVPLSF